MHRTWEEVSASLENLLASPTTKQLEVATALGVYLPSVPSLVAAAILRAELSPALMSTADHREPNFAALREIETKLAIDPAPVASRTSADVVSAWIESRYIEKRLRGLRALRPQDGDVVRLIGASSEAMIISSIGTNGRVHMRGGRGKSAWPDNLEMIARRGLSREYAAHEATILNRMRNEKTDYAPDSPLLDKIRQYRLSSLRPELSAVRELEDLLDGGDGSEGPLQKLIERHPQLLAGIVVGNNGTYVIPQKALGSEYRPDFLILGINSVGPQWLLVEIEASKHHLHNKNESLTSAVRHAVDQVESWRDWLSTNVMYAQQELGLHGLTNRVPGLVIIGRADPAIVHDRQRSRVRDQGHIQIQSWDWILRQAQELANDAFPLAVYEEGAATALVANDWLP